MPLNSRLRLDVGQSFSLAELDTFVTVAKHRGATQQTRVDVNYDAAGNDPRETPSLSLTIEVPEA